MVPQTQHQWRLRGKGGFDFLELVMDAPVPTLEDRDVLVQIHAVSLNFRDVLVAKGLYPFRVKEDLVPVSDGAGIIVAVGPGVTRFRVGDRVAAVFFPEHLAGAPTESSRSATLGGSIDGMLQQYAAFNEQSVVKAPSNLDMAEIASLPCAALTAWNALYGLEGRALKQGDTVLTEGTGGVSTFAIQFAKSAGAHVIATTSSDQKVEHVKALGADHVLNYKEIAEWGKVAKSLTACQEGVSHVVAVGGPKTLRQALNALKLNGTVAMVGAVGGFEAPDQPSFMETVTQGFAVWGVSVGSRQQFEEMNKAIEANNIKPVVDPKIFNLEQAKEAFVYLADQEHIGKVVIQVA